MKTSEKIAVFSILVTLLLGITGYLLDWFKKEPIPIEIQQTIKGGGNANITKTINIIQGE